MQMTRLLRCGRNTLQTWAHLLRNMAPMPTFTSMLENSCLKSIFLQSHIKITKAVSITSAATLIEHLKKEETKQRSRGEGKGQQHSSSQSFPPWLHHCMQFRRGENMGKVNALTKTYLQNDLAFGAQFISFFSWPSLFCNKDARSQNFWLM